MSSYATTTQLEDWIPADLDMPSDAARLLNRASEKVDELLLMAIYQVDDDGLPTDAKIIQALADATCAQASWWIETGDEQGYASVVQSASSGGGPSASGQVQSSAPQALRILRTTVDTSGCPLLAGPWNF